MSLTLDDNQASYQIRSYQPGVIQVNDKRLTNSIIITAQSLIENWPPNTVSDLTREHFADIISLRPAVLLIGTGSTLQFPSTELYGDLINAGIGVEVMDTSAACRTYNALTAENRNVAAALIVR